MRLKYQTERKNEDGEVVIKVKEVATAYYDARSYSINRHSESFLHQGIRAFYSENGELAEIVLTTRNLEKEFVWSPSEFEEKDKELTIPDFLPRRKYVFLWGKDNGEPKGCVDSFEDMYGVDDLMLFEGYLTMWRLDGYEMDKEEITELRTAVFDTLNYLWDIDQKTFVYSAYWKKKLFFWPSEVDCEFDCIAEILDNAPICQRMFSFEEEQLDEFFDLYIVNFSEIGRLCGEGYDVSDFFNDHFHTQFTDGRVLLIELNNEYETKKEDLIEICERTDEYQNRMLITYDGLSRENIKYLKDKNIEVRSEKEIFRELNLAAAESFDSDETGEDEYKEVFGDD